MKHNSYVFINVLYVKKLKDFIYKLIRNIEWRIKNAIR